MLSLQQLQVFRTDPGEHQGSSGGQHPGGVPCPGLQQLQGLDVSDHGYIQQPQAIKASYSCVDQDLDI